MTSKLCHALVFLALVAGCGGTSDTTTDAPPVDDAPAADATEVGPMRVEDVFRIAGRGVVVVVRAPADLTLEPGATLRHENGRTWPVLGDKRTEVQKDETVGLAISADPTDLVVGDRVYVTR